VAPGKFSYVRRKVPRYKRDLCSGAAHMDGKRSMLPGFQWRRVRFESSPANVMENGGDWRFPQETPTVALPGWRPGEGSTTSAIGEDASTSAGCPAIVTSLGVGVAAETFSEELEAVC
jgi:hypothetical protein